MAFLCAGAKNDKLRSATAVVLIHVVVGYAILNAFDIRPGEVVKSSLSGSIVPIAEGIQTSKAGIGRHPQTRKTDVLIGLFRRSGEEARSRPPGSGFVRCFHVSILRQGSKSRTGIGWPFRTIVSEAVKMRTSA